MPSLCMALPLCVFDRLHADGQLRRDFLVAVPSGDEPQRVGFARTQRWRRRASPARRHRPYGRRQRIGGHRRIDVGPAVRNGANGLQHLRGAALLQHIAAGPSLEQLMQVRHITMPRERQDLHRRGSLAKCLGRLQTVEARHRHVHQHHIGPQLVRLLEHGLAVGGFSDHLHVGLCVQNHAKSRPHGLVIVCQENP